MTSIWANFNHMFGVFQGIFLTSSYNKKMYWGQGCRTDTFWKKLICLFFKSLLLDLSNFRELWRYNFFACFDIVFVQLGIIIITKNKFFGMIAVAVQYLITDVQNNESKKQLLLIMWLPQHQLMEEWNVNANNRMS